MGNYVQFFPILRFFLWNHWPEIIHISWLIKFFYLKQVFCYKSECDDHSATWHFYLQKKEHYILHIFCKSMNCFTVNPLFRGHSDKSPPLLKGKRGGLTRGFPYTCLIMLLISRIWALLCGLMSRINKFS